jgi:hypothetical protein
LLEIRGVDAASWSAELTVPAGTAAEFHLPFAGRAAVQGGGRSIAPRVLREERGRQVLGLVPGSWTLRMDAAGAAK